MFTVDVQVTKKGVKFHDDALTIQKGKPFKIVVSFDSGTAVAAVKFEEFHLLKYNSSTKKYGTDLDAGKLWKDRKQMGPSAKAEFPGSFTIKETDAQKERTFGSRKQDPDSAHRLVKFKVWVIPKPGLGEAFNVDPILDERPGG
jgi:hypothetical protein